MKMAAKRSYLEAIYERYQQATGKEKSRILDEFCKVCKYKRKYAIAKLNGWDPEEKVYRQRKRKPTYGEQLIRIIFAVWNAAGYACSIRLKALLPLWLPWIKKRFPMSQQIEKELLTISARQIDRRLRHRKDKLKKRQYGRTKPGTLLKSQIPMRVEHWNVKAPGYTEVDLVSHSGNYGDGQFAYSLNQTDILTTWVETRAILGKSEKRVVTALQSMGESFPFRIVGIDSDNGSEFINHELYRYCQENQIQFTRGRPYKKDDNAHIEQKNWTHVRKLVGWERYDSIEAVTQLNDLYQNELRWLMNLFIPSVKLKKKVRRGSKLRKFYDSPKTPLDRLIESGHGSKKLIDQLLQRRNTLDPFDLSAKIEHKLRVIFSFANRHHSPNAKLLATLGRKRFQTLNFVSNRRKAASYVLFSSSGIKQG
jgi:transposase InsO family protein